MPLDAVGGLFAELRSSRNFVGQIDELGRLSLVGSTCFVCRSLTKMDKYAAHSPGSFNF